MFILLAEHQAWLLVTSLIALLNSQDVQLDPANITECFFVLNWVRFQDVSVLTLQSYLYVGVLQQWHFEELHSLQQETSPRNSFPIDI